MTEADRSVPIDDLMAYVDGRLGAADRARVESYLASQPEARAQVDAYREQNRALHALFDPVLDEPVPANMRVPEPRRHARWIAGLAAMLVAGLAIGWFARGYVSVPVPVVAFAQQAAVAHIAYTPEVRHPVEVAASEAHLFNWLSKRLGRKVFAPDLAGEGYRLVGGRLLPGDAGKVAAQFMYENQSGQRLTLYIRALSSRDRDTAFRYSRDAGVDTFYWIDASWGYALTGAIGRDAMLKLADVVYKQLSPS